MRAPRARAKVSGHFARKQHMTLLFANSRGEGQLLQVATPPGAYDDDVMLSLKCIKSKKWECSEPMARRRRIFFQSNTQDNVISITVLFSHYVRILLCVSAPQAD